ncbi:MAG: 1-acyl-sn-glycerol-3-phosphate acyltransferase [Bacteroidia bacterium]|nr:1-acyl-sn-glycerol-3-phosphate acyltransferase [Bacteroidia bacterium]
MPKTSIYTYLFMLPRVIWKLFFIINFIIGLVVLYPLFYLLLQGNAPYTKAFALMRFWACWILHVPGIFVHTKGNANVATTPCVLVANHASYLDIIVSYVVFNFYFVFVGKSEIRSAPLFNVFFKRMNILVDRGNASSGATAYKACSERLQRGESVFLFPEGGIRANSDMRTFKNGAFQLAIDNQVPIVPVTFRNNWKLLQTGAFFKCYGTPGIAQVVVHNSVPTLGLTKEYVPQLKKTVFDVIKNAL